MNNIKMIVSRVLSDLVPGTGLIAQNGAQWRFSKPVPGLEAFSTRTYTSEAEAIEILSDHYARQFESSNVSGLRPGEHVAPTGQEKKAV